MDNDALAQVLNAAGAPQVKPGENYDEPFEEAPKFKPNALAQTPDDLNDFDLRDAGRTPPGLTAHVAVQQPQAQAAQTLTTAKAQDLPPAVVAADPLKAERDARQRQILKDLEQAPAVAQYAAQGPAQAAVIQHETPQYGFVTRWLSGTSGTDEPLPEQSNVGTAIGRGVMTALADWEQFQAFKMKSGGWVGVGAHLLSGLGLLNPVDTPPEVHDAAVEAQQKKADELTQLAQHQTPLEKQSSPFALKTVNLAAQVAPYVAAPELAVPGMFIQSVGGLNAAGVSPDHAVVGGTIAALLGAKTADILSESLAPLGKIGDVQKFIAKWTTDLLGHPAAVQTALQTGRHAVFGWATAAGMDFTQRVTQLVDDAAKKGRSVDPSEYVAAFKESAKGALSILPLIGLTSGLGLIGKHIEAHANGLSHDAMTVPLEGTKVPPAEAQEIFRNAKQRPDPNAQTVETRPVRPAATETEPGPVSTGTKYVYIDPEHFEKVIKAAGEDPKSLANKVAGNGAWTHSVVTGAKLEVPISDYLTTLAPFHAELRDGVARTDDGATLSQNHAQWLAEETANAQGAKAAEPKSQGPEVSKAPPQGPQAASLPTEFRAISSPLDALKARVEVEPTAKGLKTYAEAHAQEQTITALENMKGRYTRLANEAQHKADKLSAKTIDLLASAEQAAQQGIDEATAGLEQARGGVIASEAARTTTAKTLQAAIRRIVTTKRMAGVDPTAISDDVNGMVQEGIKTAVKKAVADADLTPEKIKTIVQTEVNEARKAFRESGVRGQTAEDKSVQATEKTVRAGDNAAEVQSLQRKRDLNLAMEKARAAVVKVTDKQSEKLITDSASDAARKDLYQRGTTRAFGEAHDMLMEALNLREPDGTPRPPSFEAAATHLLQHGHVMDFEVGPLDDLCRNPKSIGELKPSELDNVVRASDTLRKLAKDEAETYVNGETRNIQDQIQNVIAPSVAAGAPKPWTRRQAFDKNFHALLQPLGNVGQAIVQRFLTVRANRDNLLARVIDAYRVDDALVERSKVKVETPQDWPDAMRKAYPELTQRHLWAMAHIAGTEEGMGAVERATGWSPEQVHGWLEGHIPKEEWDSFQQHKDVRDEFGRLLAGAVSNEGGVPLKMKTPRTYTAHGETYTGFYAPVRWLDKGGLPFKTEPTDPSAGISKAMQDDFTKEQQAHVDGVLDISWDRMAHNYRDVANYLSMHDFVMDNARLFNAPGFKDAVAPLGPDYLEALKAWHNTVRTSQSPHDLRYRDTLLARLASDTARAAFSMNLKSIAGLEGHLPILKTTYGDDFNVGSAATISPEKWARADALSPEVVQYRFNNYGSKLREMMNQMYGGGAHKIMDVAFLPSQELWHGADALLTHQVWNGFYDAALEKLKDPDAARLRANELTDRSMPPIDIYGKSLRTTDPWLGMLALTKNFQNSVSNMQAMRAWEARAGIKPGGMPMYWAWKAGVTGAIAMTGYALYGEGRNEIEQKEGGKGWALWGSRQMAEAWAFPGILSHVVAGTLSPVLEGWATGHPQRVEDMLPSVAGQNLTAILRDLGKEVRLAEGKGKMTDGLKAGLDLAGRACGFPPPPLVRMADGAYKVAKYQLLGSRGDEFTGRTPKTWVGKAGKVWFGDTDKYRSNAASDLDELVGGGR